MENLEHRFSMIGLTETWLNPSNIDAYGIDGYNHVGITRNNQHGGGVSLFICIWNVILGAHLIYQGYRRYWMFISQNQFQGHIVCHWNSLSPSKQWFRTIYWNIKLYTQSNNTCPLLNNGRSVKAWMSAPHLTFSEYYVLKFYVTFNLQAYQRDRLHCYAYR